MDKYILIEGEPVLCDDLMQWARWFARAERRVARDYVSDILISTVFLGIDHRYGDGPPLLFETMVFAPDNRALDEFTERYSSLAEAKAGHALIVEQARQWTQNPKATS